MKTCIWILMVLSLMAGRGGVFAAQTSAPAVGKGLPSPAIYQISNLKYGDLLRPRNANHANGTPIVLHPAQPWKCMSWKLQPAGKSGFHVRNLFTAKTFSANPDTSGKAMDVTQVPLPKDKAAGSPIWQFTRLKDGNYKITDAKSGAALTAMQADGDPAPKITVAPWRNLDEQKWTLSKIDPKQLTM